MMLLDAWWLVMLLEVMLVGLLDVGYNTQFGDQNVQIQVHLPYDWNRGII